MQTFHLNEYIETCEVLEEIVNGPDSGFSIFG